MDRCGDSPYREKFNNEGTQMRKCKHKWEMIEFGKGYLLLIDGHTLCYEITKQEISRNLDDLINDAIDLRVAIVARKTKQRGDANDSTET